MTYFQVKNCRIICSDDALSNKNDLFFCVKNGISKIIPESEVKTEPKVILGNERLLLPAFTDIGGNFFDPDFKDRDSLQTASAALSSGGYRRIYTFSNRCFEDDRVKNIAPIPQRLENIEKNGIYYGFHDKNRDLMTVFSALNEKNALYVSAGIDTQTIDGEYSSGMASKMMSTKGITLFEECSILAQELLAAYETGCRLHIRAVASKEALGMIKEAKKMGVKVTCGVSPIHLALVDIDVLYYARMCKILPPLRSKIDREALREGVFDGSIDCISSLHTPLSKKEKSQPSPSSPFGVASIETVLPVLLTYVPELITSGLHRLPSLLSEMPSRIINDCYSLKIGASADFVLVDPKTELVVSENTLRSKSVNTPFMGHTLMSSLRLYYNGYLM